MELKFSYSIDELAELGKPGRTKLFEAVRNGELKARKSGRSTIVLREDYLEFLRNLPSADTAQPSSNPVHGPRQTRRQDRKSGRA